VDLFDDLHFRGLIYQVTDEPELRKKLAQEQVSLYAGFDPTADSLHIGSLLPILVLRRFQLAGHKPIALIGGGTGLIGDPSGRVTERQLNSRETIQGWIKNFEIQLGHFLDFGSGANAAQILDNYEWLGSLKVIDFMRDIGKHFPIGYMLAKDSVKSRLDAGISFTEFSYMLMQSYDFLNLNKTYGCDLQVGGSDQWGNITAGIELIRKMDLGQAYGITSPLVEKADGTKFGKSETGTIWLDAQKTSPYQFYQFWINTDDRDVVKYLKYFTFLGKDEILALENEVETNPGKREAQNVLASDVTTLVHGKDALISAENISKALFYGNINELSESELEDAFKDIPSSEIKGDDELNPVKILVEYKISSSNRQAREDLNNGSIYLNGVRITDLNKPIKKSDRLFGKYLVVRRGKKKYFLFRWN
jgi:tyrosyl-tRNA synthetase